MIALQVIDLVNGIRKKMPKLGTKKLYHKLKKALKDLGVGRDKLFDILRANSLLIKPKKQYHIENGYKKSYLSRERFNSSF